MLIKRFLVFVIGLVLCFLLFAFPAGAEPLMGGWTPSASPEITEEIQAMFDKAMEGLLGVSYVPVAYLGSQVVAGTNHCLLCQAAVVYPGASPYYVLLYLYENLEGQVSILQIARLDPGLLCTYGAEE